jgi:hypothetical protein
MGCAAALPAAGIGLPLCQWTATYRPLAVTGSVGRSPTGCRHDDVQNVCSNLNITEAMVAAMEKG